MEDYNGITICIYEGGFEYDYGYTYENNVLEITLLDETRKIIDTQKINFNKGKWTFDLSKILSSDNIGYFISAEAQFNGIVVYKTTVDQMISLLGQPDKIENREDGYPYSVYFYDGVQYLTFGKSDKISTIVITEYTEADSPRDIRIGDSLKSVMAKFPYEQDPLQNADGIFFGKWGSQRGTINDEILSDGTVIKKLVVTSESEDPFMIVRFKDDIVYEIVITIRTD
jgi:hypothetical protein